VAAEALVHPILQKTMNEDDIAASEFLAASHLFPDELAMVADELDVEVLHLTASATLAGCCLLDVADPLTEGEDSVSIESWRREPSSFSVTA
jgi:hypothetical protein